MKQDFKKILVLLQSRPIKTTICQKMWSLKIINLLPWTRANKRPWIALERQNGPSTKKELLSFHFTTKEGTLNASPLTLLSYLTFIGSLNERLLRSTHWGFRVRITTVLVLLVQWLSFLHPLPNWEIIPWIWNRFCFCAILIPTVELRKSEWRNSRLQTYTIRIWRQISIVDKHNDQNVGLFWTAWLLTNAEFFHIHQPDSNRWKIGEASQPNKGISNLHF